MKCLHWLTKSRWYRTSYILFRLRLNDPRNHQFGSPVLRISLTEVVSRVSPARLPQFVKCHLLLPKTLHVMLYWFRDCAHHTAGFVMFAKIALLRIFLIIIPVFPILPIVWTCKIAQILSDGIPNLLKCCFRLGGCQSHVVSISYFFLHLLNCRLCVFDSLSCHSGLSFHMILKPILLLFIA